ncbi:Structure-specific endonuclease subunit SLX1 [Pseudozyma hubeiensis]|nr:Structure-specific endonuclease subunit SLX1 [Pseudozyma hubeiensis]
MPSSVTKHTIPPFYACYFLRSLSSPGTTYIGSTPAPPRRKRQHNGDLTQGAYKTARARPWEMECIVYGFSSKIAALQFEWAWAKPHLSRHLKFLTTEHSLNGSESDTSAWAGLALFPSTSMTPGQTRWGRPKKRMARPPSTPNARLLAMRALLQSEPFCGWGLKLAFFSEWSWLAYQRLDAANGVAEATTSTSQWNRYSRSGKPLHALYPVAVCDFAGVDGKRIPLVHISAQHRLDAGVADQPVKKRQSSSKKKPDADDPPGWPETLPRSANLKGLDACIQDFAAFPLPRPAATSTDLTKKAKRARKTSDKIAGEDEDAEKDEDDDDATDATRTLLAEPGAVSTRALHRMRFDDLDMEESEWKRFELAVAANLDPSTTTTKAMSDFLQICGQRYVAAQDARTRDTAAPAPTAPCSLCNTPVDLSQQLEFVLCPTPHANTLPISSGVSSTNASTAELGDNGCDSIFHLSCLAKSFLEQQRGAAVGHNSASTVLPTHGTCLCHKGQQEQSAPWADVIRAMYRRHERFERLVQFLVRSGRTFEEHLNPAPEVEVVVKGNRGKGKAKVPTDKDEEAAGEIGADEADIGPVKKTRKRRQPTISNMDGVGAAPVAENGAQVHQVTAKKETKRKTTRKAKLTEPSDVIDLT